MNKIKEILEKKGVKKRWLAEQIGKSAGSISDYCGNKNQPSLETLIKIAKVLKVRPGSLINEKYNGKK